jgi:hypothetical protein
MLIAEAVLDYDFGGGGEFIVQRSDHDVVSVNNSSGDDGGDPVIREQVLAAIREAELARAHRSPAAGGKARLGARS